MATRKDEHGLTPRQRVFIDEYLIDCNGQRAATKAGYSEKGAAVTASKMLIHPKVAAYLKLRSAKLGEAAGLSAQDVLKSLGQALRFDPRKLYNADGSLKSILELDEDTAAVLAGVEVVEMAGPSSGNGESVMTMFTKKVKWLDKNSAREQAMKHFGLYRRDNEQIGNPLKEMLELLNATRGRKGLI